VRVTRSHSTTAGCRPQVSRQWLRLLATTRSLPIPGTKAIRPSLQPGFVSRPSTPPMNRESRRSTVESRQEPVGREQSRNSTVKEIVVPPPQRNDFFEADPRKSGHVFRGAQIVPRNGRRGQSDVVNTAPSRAGGQIVRDSQRISRRGSGSPLRASVVGLPKAAVSSDCCNRRYRPSYERCAHDRRHPHSLRHRTRRPLGL
jgi:hypothetical protein